MTTPKVPPITPGLRAAVETYLLAKAYTETIRPVVEAYQAEVVAVANLQYSDEFAPEYTGTITSMKDSWMMDGRQSDAFYAALDAAHAAHGFVDLEPGHCPLLTAEYAELQAMWLICDEVAYITKIDKGTATSHPDTFRRYVELTVQFVLSACPDITTASVMQKVLQ